MIASCPDLLRGNITPKSRFYLDQFIGGRSPPIVELYRQQQKDIPPKRSGDTYFDLMDKIRQEWKRQNVARTIQYCLLSYPCIEPWVRSECKEYGTFQVLSIPAIELGLKLFAVTGARGQIDNLRDLIDFIPELERWKDEVASAYTSLELSSRILDALKGTPGILQKDLRKHLGTPDGRLITNTLYYMEICGRARRNKYGNTHELFAETTHPFRHSAGP